MSQILFEIFIDGLAREVRRANQGVKILDLKINILLFADDIILLGSSRQELQKLLDIVSCYSEKWKFAFNGNKSKVVVFGTQAVSRERYFLGFQQLEVVNQFKYLGVDFKNNFSWKDHKNRIGKKAHSRVAGINKVVAEGLTIEAGEKLWTSMIRPILEYGAEVWGGGRWIEAEQIMRKVGKTLLGLPRTANNEVVQGELGWWSMESRRDLLRLKYWGRVLNMPLERLPRQVYESSRKITENLPGSWTHTTKSLLINLNLTAAWHHQKVGDMKDWTVLVKQCLKDRESREWKSSILTKSKLKLYSVLKTKLVREDYLDFDSPKSYRTLVTQFRCGSNELRLDMGRRKKENRNDRLCLMCVTGKVEDEKHVLLECYIYSEFRDKLFDDVRLLTGYDFRRMEDDPLWIIETLLGEGLLREKDRRVVNRSVGSFLAKSMKLRNQTLVSIR